MKHRTVSWFVVFITLSAFLVGCGPSKEEKERAAKKAELDQQITVIEQAWNELKDLRSQVAAKQAELKEIEAISKRKRTPEQKQALETLPGEITELKQKVDTDYEALQDKLADFLNVALNEFPDDPVTDKALMIYSEEALVTAADHIRNAGDYKKAIEILATAKNYYENLGKQPYDKLVKAIAQYEDMRTITRERFDAVKKGMTMDEVSEVAGPAYYGNRREDPKKGAIMWLYPRRDGGAAAIYFKKKTGKVYGKKWDAVKPQVKN